MEVVHEIVAHSAAAAVLSRVIEQIGAYAGFASLIGLAILAALYFSQARDVKRLREWAGRAPERSVEAESGRTPQATAVRTGQPAGTQTVSPAQPVARPVGTQPPSGGQPQAQPQPAAANAGAAVAPAAAGGAATPAGVAASAAGAVPATASAAAAAGAAAPAGGAARAPGIVARAASGSGVAAPVAAPPRGTPGSNTGTGAKVLPARQGQPRPRPIPRGGSGQTSVMAPPKQGPERRWPAGRYLALIVAGVLVLGFGGTMAVLALTGGKSKRAAATAPASTVALPKNTKHKPASSKSRRSFAPAIDPSTVTVAVLNSTRVTGLGGRIGQRVRVAGFTLGNVATSTAQQRAESVVLYRPGSSRQARAVARRLGITQIEPADAASAALAGAATVVVVVGADKSRQ